MQLFIATILSFAATATAFNALPGAGRATMRLSAKSKSVPFLDEPSKLIGMPGYKGFDPLGFSDVIDPKFLAEAEIKHGRIAMLGWLGFVATEFVKLPGAVHDVSPVEAHNAAVESGAMFQILAFISAIEAVSVVAVKVREC